MPMQGHVPTPVVPMSLTESKFIIYRWEEGGHMEFERRLFVKHEYGTACTNEMVRQHIEDEIDDFRPAKYRAVPDDRMIDFEIKAEVVLS